MGVVGAGAGTVAPPPAQPAASMSTTSADPSIDAALDEPSKVQLIDSPLAFLDLPLIAGARPGKDRGQNRSDSVTVRGS